MRIGYDAKRLFCNHRGLGNYSRDLIRILSSYYPENIYHLYASDIKINVKTNPENTTIICPEGIYKFLPNALWRSYGMKNQIVKSGDEIFHGLSQELPFGIEKTNVKKVITFHDAIFIRYPELYNASYRKIITLKTQRACRLADRIIAISEQSKRDAIEFFGADANKVEVIYQGCNNNFRKPVSYEEKTHISSKYNLPKDYILYVGAIEPRKNIESIINAIFQEKIDIPLVVIGRKTDYVNELHNLVEKRKLALQVQFLHNVETPDLPAVYQLAQLFVYPSVFEGFGIPILEALCSETPVITSKGSCFEETGGDYSMYVQHQNSQEIGQSIQKILTDSELQKTMKREGLIHAEKFKDNIIADKLVKLYKYL